MELGSKVSTELMITATAPAKAILLGEHAVNRGQTALAVSVGLHATCTLLLDPQPLQAKADGVTGVGANDGYRFETDGHEQTTSRRAILELGHAIDGYRAASDYVSVQELASNDFFAPTKYVLAALGEALPAGMHVRFSSTIPQFVGLGSGGASFVALGAAMNAMLGEVWDAHKIAGLALRGDIIAHGGIASGLDTQTSLYGGAIRYTVERQGESVLYAQGLMLVIGNTGVVAATSEVNGRVRAWLAERPTRLHYFHEIGLLSRLAEVALREGNWRELGQLLNLNQLILERIGVSCPELERLNGAALEAGAMGAKLSGSGGGGIMIALATPETAAGIAAAITQAGGQAIVAPIGVAGASASVSQQPDKDQE